MARDALTLNPPAFYDPNAIMGFTMHPPYWVAGPDGEVALIVLKQQTFYTPSEWPQWSYGSVGFPNQVGWIYNSSSTPEPSSYYLMAMIMLFRFVFWRIGRK